MINSSIGVCTDTKNKHLAHGLLFGTFPIYKQWASILVGYKVGKSGTRTKMFSEKS